MLSIVQPGTMAWRNLCTRNISIGQWHKLYPRYWDWWQLLKLHDLRMPSDAIVSREILSESCKAKICMKMGKQGGARSPRWARFVGELAGSVWSVWLTACSIMAWILAQSRIFWSFKQIALENVSELLKYVNGFKLCRFVINRLPYSVPPQG